MLLWPACLWPLLNPTLGLAAQMVYCERSLLLWTAAEGGQWGGGGRLVTVQMGGPSPWASMKRLVQALSIKLQTCPTPATASQGPQCCIPAMPSHWLQLHVQMPPLPTNHACMQFWPVGNFTAKPARHGARCGQGHPYIICRGGGGLAPGARMESSRQGAALVCNVVDGTFQQFWAPWMRALGPLNACSAQAGLLPLPRALL